MDHTWPVDGTSYEARIELIFRTERVPGGTQYLLVYSLKKREKGARDWIKFEEVTRPLQGSEEYLGINKLTRDANEMSLDPDRTQRLWNHSRSPVKAYLTTKQWPDYKQAVEDILRKVPSW